MDPKFSKQGSSTLQITFLDILEVFPLIFKFLNGGQSSNLSHTKRPQMGKTISKPSKITYLAYVYPILAY